MYSFLNSRWFFLLLGILYPYLLLDGASMGILSCTSLLFLRSTPFLLLLPSPPLLLPLLLFFGLPCHFALFASSPTSLLASPTFFPSVASLGILSGSPLLATLCSILSLFLILISSPSLFLSSFLSSLSILLHLLPASYPPLKVFALSSHVGSFFALAPPMIFIRLQSPFLFAAYATGAAYAAGCRGPPATLLYGLLVLSSPLNVELIFPMHLIANLCSSLFWRVDNDTTRTFTGGEGNGVTSLWHTVRLVLLSSPISSPFTYSRTPPHSPRLPTPFSPYFSFAPPHISRSGLSTETFYPSFCPPTPFLFLQILLMISPGLPLCTSLLRLHLPSSLHIKIINSNPCYHSPSLITPTFPTSWRRLLRIVLRFFGDCPRAGLFAATTLSRFWNCVATYAWLGLALAVSCAFYAVFASPSQDKLSGLWGGCSFTFHYCFTTVSPLLLKRSTCWRVYLALNFSQVSISNEILN